jgi:hypothetical protein
LLGGYGFLARLRARRGWVPRHAIGMGGSYIARLTAVYLHNGPFLPLCGTGCRTGPSGCCSSLVGAPVTWLAVHRVWRGADVNRSGSDLRG